MDGGSLREFLIIALYNVVASTAELNRAPFESCRAIRATAGYHTDIQVCNSGVLPYRILI